MLPQGCLSAAVRRRRAAGLKTQGVFSVYTRGLN